MKPVPAGTREPKIVALYWRRLRSRNGFLSWCGLLLAGSLGCGPGGDIVLLKLDARSSGAAGAATNGGAAGSSGAASSSRDALLAPYASSSIWNTPLGDQASWVAVTLQPALAGIRTEAVVILLDLQQATLSIQHSDAGWTGADRCPAHAPEHFTARAPAPFLVLEGPGVSGAPVVALQDDQRSLRQGLPFARCTTSAPATVQFEEDAGDLLGDGIQGANGGSGLSALGGVLRLGELGPRTGPPRHALAIHVNDVSLYAAATKSDCFRWPASRGDAYCVGTYAGANPALRMGALLALPPGTALALRTEPAKLLAWTLGNYGAYVVNDAGSASYAFNVELSPQGWFVDEFESAWGFPFQTTALGALWAQDIQDLFNALAVVDDNVAATPGGAGKRVQPLLPELSPR